MGGGVEEELQLLILDTRQRRVFNLTPQRLCLRDKTRHPIEQVAVWVPRQISAFWKRGKSLTSAGIRTPEGQAYAK
jgi:hypothetical protein